MSSRPQEAEGGCYACAALQASSLGRAPCSRTRFAIGRDGPPRPDEEASISGGVVPACGGDIIDSTTAAPICNEDGSVWIVFNGEIYDYRELRRELEQKGHTFRTASDTETIVHLYEDLGPRCVDRLRGMFAFAIWDIPARRLTLARDRLGIKPLYYTQRDGVLVFASELKPILQLPHVERTVSWEAASHLFTFLATPSSQIRASP